MDPDKDLVLRAQGGDKRAFDELVTRHRGRICGICTRLLDSQEDAEQITQESFLRAWSSLSGFQGDSQLFTWLYKIARNQCWKLLESRSRRSVLEGPNLDDLRSPPEGQTVAPGPEEEVITSVLAQQGLKLLPDYVRTARPPWDALDLAIFELYYVRDVETAREVAQLLGRKEQTVAYRLRVHINPVLKRLGNDLCRNEELV